MLRRVKERDLYSCCTTTRIPKLEQNCSKCEDKETKDNFRVAKGLFLSDEKRSEFAKNVCDNFKASVEASKLSDEELWVEVSSLSIS